MMRRERRRGEGMMRRERRRGEGMMRRERRGEEDEVSPALLLALEVQVPSPSDCHVTWKRGGGRREEGG